MKSHKTEGYGSTSVQQSIFRVGDYGCWGSLDYTGYHRFYEAQT